MRYPMVGILFALAAGLVVASASTLPPPPALWVGVGAACLVLAVALRRTTARRAILFGCIAILGLLRGAAEPDVPEWLALRAPRISEVTGTIVSYPSLGVDRIRFVVKPDELPKRILATWDCPLAAAGSVHYGDRVRLAGRAERPGTFDGFDYAEYLERQDIFATMWVESAGLTRLGHESGVLRWGDQLRQAFLSSLQQRLPPGEFALAQSYIFGDRFALSDETEEAFARTGLMHILAVSGMHLAVLLAGVWLVLRALHVRPAVAYLVVVLVVLAAVWIIGPWISFLRSALLFLFVAAGSVLADLGFILRASIRPMNALAAASCTLLLAQPACLFDVGFQLSVAATAGLLAFAPRRGWPAFARLPRFLAATPRLAASLLLVSLAAQAGAAPILALQFEKLQMWTAVTGILAIPLSTVALWAGVVAIACSAWGPIAAATAQAFGLTLRLFEGVVIAAARLPGSAVPSDGRVGLWLAGLVVVLYFAREVVARPPRLTIAERRAGLAMAVGPAITDNRPTVLTGGGLDPSLLHDDAHGQRVPDRAQSDSAAYAEAGEAVARALRLVPRRVGGAGKPALLRVRVVDAGGGHWLGAQRRGDRRGA
ncbi:MAG: ComEC/Rec2 family competence protein [bacterium]